MNGDKIKLFSYILMSTFANRARKEVNRSQNISTGIPELRRHHGYMIIYTLKISDSQVLSELFAIDNRLKEANLNVNEKMGGPFTGTP